MNIIKQQKIREQATVFAIKRDGGFSIVYEFESDKGHFHDALKGDSLFGETSRLNSADDAVVREELFDNSFECAWCSACAVI